MTDPGTEAQLERVTLTRVGDTPWEEPEEQYDLDHAREHPEIFEIGSFVRIPPDSVVLVLSKLEAQAIVDGYYDGEPEALDIAEAPIRRIATALDKDER